MATKTVAGGVSTFTPSPGQIRRDCKLIQQSWSDAALRKRLGLNARRNMDGDSLVHWLPPEVCFAFETNSIRDDE